jgi:hypothetical protein
MWRDHREGATVNTVIGHSLALHYPGLLKPWDYTWDALHPYTLRFYGLLARRSPADTAHFNLTQTIWLRRDLDMNWSPRQTPAATTLAVNVLTAHLDPGTPHNTHAFRGSTTRRILAIAPQFAREFLCTMPEHGGRIPRDVIIGWMRARKTR